MSYVCKRGYKCMCFQCGEKDCEHFESEPPKWVKGLRMTRNKAIYILRNAAWLGTNEDRELVETAVEELAAIGHWIPKEGWDGDEAYECSKCGVLWTFPDGDPEENGAFYCPNCGTKMED